MTESRLTIRELLKGKENQHLNSLKHCNFTQSLLLFLNDHGISITKEDVSEGEKENYIDRFGSFKYRNTLKIKDQGLKVQMSCLFKNEWEFHFDEIMNPHLEIKDERILDWKSDKSVMVLIDGEMHLLPLAVAEKLDLEEYNNKTVENELKNTILNVVKEYQIKSFIEIK